jgi:hypothetical protein
MAISAGKNGNYGGSLVTQKYSPLHNVTYSGNYAAECGALLNNRRLQLLNANVFPKQPLILVTDWDALSGDEGGKDPPLVVISSNRSKWIAKGAQLAIDQAKLRDYSGSNDLNALMGEVAKQVQSPPLYAPRRVDGDRRVYIVVHLHEYHQYKTALADSGMTVIGWSFRRPKTAPAPLTGFGASRYAAIEFCKYLRKTIEKEWDYAWLLDDNVVGMSKFPGFAAVETAMKDATPEPDATPDPDATPGPVCSAFAGGTKAELFETIVGWASAEVNAYPSRAKPTTLPAPETPGLIIQQAALWNIKYLTDHKLNFAPLFILSGEDISLTNYFNATMPSKPANPKPTEKVLIPEKPPIDYIYYGGMTVWKEEVKYHDESRGSKLVAQARDELASWFAAEEAKVRTPPGTLPPPVQLESKETRYPGVQTLSEFIRKWFTDAKADERPRDVAGADLKVQDKAKCQAVEQISHGAIKTDSLDPEVVYRTFKVLEENGQAIYQAPEPIRKR